ncbi:CCDC86 [Cordylochernes scorpioides]|uniref:Coiled-coil domain-containing protein 86 n=1 Tax=Cordylochernes scorpioides TaxID=51811 RepID=A0ABY6LIV0_9ARAC|nr:CCDC86 [Cordylochernes scorpioides]
MMGVDDELVEPSEVHVDDHKLPVDSSNEKDKNTETTDVEMNSPKEQESNKESKDADLESSKVNIKRRSTLVKNSSPMVRGMSKSGRVWRADKKSFSTFKIDKSCKTSWKKKMLKKAELLDVKMRQREINNRKEEENKMRKLRKAEAIKRREENIKKGETVQVIKDTTKLRKMSKKQLKHIRKEDTNM